MASVDRFTLVFLVIGVALIVGVVLALLWVDAPLPQGSYVVKADSTLQLSWYLQRGDRTEGDFTVSGGNNEGSLTVTSPSGKIIMNWYANGSYSNGFTAQENGFYTMIFTNLDSVSDQTIEVYFKSPYEPRLTIYDVIGLLVMAGGGAIIFLALHPPRRA